MPDPTLGLRFKARKDGYHASFVCLITQALEIDSVEKTHLPWLSESGSLQKRPVPKEKLQVIVAMANSPH